MVKKICALLLLSILFLPGIFAKEKNINISAKTNKNQVSAGRPFIYTITLKCKSLRGLKITPPDFSGFDILSKSTSTSYNFSQGKPSIKYTLTFLLSTQKTGKITLPKLKVCYHGKEITSPDVVIEIKPTKNPSPLPREKPEKPLQKNFQGAVTI